MGQYKGQPPKMLAHFVIPSGDCVSNEKSHQERVKSGLLTHITNPPPSAFLVGFFALSL